MLKIHKPFSKHKLLLIPITSICITFGLLGLYTLTYTPELSHAETVTSKKTIDNITYMQEMTPEICKSMELEKQYQLTDIRKNFDGTQPKYWIARLKDNNCWMTQNLDLDIPAEGLSAKDTDILEDWNDTTNPTYPPEKTQISANPSFGTVNKVIKSWDPALGGHPTYCNNGAEFGKCATSNNPTVSINDGHDAQGNYYSWGAIVAGQTTALGSDASNIQSTQSICPREWTLPTGNFGGQFEKLLDGIVLAVVTSSPYYYLYSGWIHNTSKGEFGKYGYYWSSTAWTTTASPYNAAYFMGIGNSSTPYFHGNVGYARGFPIRCLARSESTPSNNVEVAINNTISLDVTNEVEVKKSEVNPSTAAFSALVASNQPYSVSISSANPNMTSSTSSTAIPSKSGTLTSNDNAWGIKLSTTSTYEQITTTPKLFYSSSNPESKSLPFTIGISTAPDIPNGEYSTNITITATQN